MCRPRVSFAKSKDDIFFHLKAGRNPNLIHASVHQVPNDIMMVMLTGPNMGGKSTTLRLFCTTAILAQIGCYVPAESCHFSIVDRIFTRIGAGDKLVEGKSTFYVEMEEVKSAVSYATYNSLAIFDELGRGTSTFDGVAIAYGVLRYCIEKIQFRCMFATHFFLLVNELRFYKNISLYHMDFTFNDEAKQLLFKYKLKPGSAKSSFGIYLAKMVGMDESIMKHAEKKKIQFDRSHEVVSVHKQQVVAQFNMLIAKLFTQYEANRK